MFNSHSVTNRNLVSTHVNAVTGNITKTYKESFFKRFHLTSETAKRLFEPVPILYCKRDKKASWEMYEEVVIIQMVVVGDMEVLAEVMFKDDYERAVNDEG